MTEPQIEALREELLELAKDCPLEDGNPEDCILHHVRHMSPAQRLDWVRSLSPDTMSFLLFYHHISIDCKLKAQQGQPGTVPNVGLAAIIPPPVSNPADTTLVDW